MIFTTRRCNYNLKKPRLQDYSRNVYGWYDPESDKTECLEDFISEIYYRGGLKY